MQGSSVGQVSRSLREHADIHFAGNSVSTGRSSLRVALLCFKEKTFLSRRCNYFVAMMSFLVLAF
jgi:hypothetical protein